MPSLAHCIESYILAKDGNRPELLTQAFEPDAGVTLDVQTDQIAFPARLSGREQISDALVRQFSQDYDNVLTFCLTSPPSLESLQFRCPWLVVMTSRQDGRLRSGWGLYDWQRDSADASLVALTITILDMVTEAPESSGSVLRWAASLPYPWCPAEQLWATPPALPALASWREAIDEQARLN